MKPRRNVINTRRGPPTETGANTVIQTLECGHELQFSGQAAIKARTAEYRQCGQCPDIDNGGKVTKSQRHRQSRAGNLKMPDW